MTAATFAQTARRFSALAAQAEETARNARQLAAQHQARRPEETAREAQDAAQAARDAERAAEQAEDAADDAARASYAAPESDEAECIWIAAREAASKARLCADMAERHAAIAAETARQAKQQRRLLEAQAEHEATLALDAAAASRDADAADQAAVIKVRQANAALGIAAILFGRMAAQVTTPPTAGAPSAADLDRLLLDLQVAAIDYEAAEARREETSAARERAFDAQLAQDARHIAALRAIGIDA